MMNAMQHGNMIKCTVDECDKPSRSQITPSLCEAHYARLRRTGSVSAHIPLGIKRPAGTPCEVENCTKPRLSGAYCQMHAARMQRHGNTDFEGPKPRYGVDNPSWKGEVATYGAIHMRLRDRKGRAAQYTCVDCGQVAQQWSYTRNCLTELQSELGPYCRHEDHYVSRCIPCHKTFDLAAIGEESILL